MFAFLVVYFVLWSVADAVAVWMYPRHKQDAVSTFPPPNCFRVVAVRLIAAFVDE
jgi:hypothetical protein